MARKTNYEEKMEAIKAKIEKKTEEVKGLKAQMAALEGKKLKDDFKALNEWLAQKELAPDEVLGKLKEIYGE